MLARWRRYRAEQGIGIGYSNIDGLQQYSVMDKVAATLSVLALVALVVGGLYLAVQATYWVTGAFRR